MFRPDSPASHCEGTVRDRFERAASALVIPAWRRRPTTCIHDIQLEHVAGQAVGLRLGPNASETRMESG